MRLRKKRNRLERRQDNKDKKEFFQKGGGLYEFRNNTSGTLSLPKPAANNVKNVPMGGTFQGDSYFMFMVKTNDLKIIRTIEEPVTVNVEEVNMSEEKLILDQPDTITPAGKVEHVVDKQQPLNEISPSPENKPTNKVLINEEPIDGIEIILND